MTEVVIPVPPPSRRLRLARLFWILLASLTLLLGIARAPGYFAQLVADADPRTLETLGVSANVLAGYVMALYALIAFVHLIPGLIIFRRKSEVWMCLFVALTLVMIGALIPVSIMYEGVSLSPTWRALVNGVTYVGVTSSLLVLYLFPDGRFVPRWTALLAVLWAGGNGLGIFFPDAWISLPRWPTLLQFGVLLAWLMTGVLAQLHRYQNVSTQVQRQQIKWAVVGLTAAALAPLAYYVWFVILPSFGNLAVSGIGYQRIGPEFFAVSLLSRLGGLTFFAVLALVFPLSFAVAILRYRLWDIDIIIRRTLIYGTVTTLLSLIYLLSIVMLQAVFQTLTGRGDNQLVTVVSTLASTVLFFPLRNRVQDFVDRQFYRKKYDAAKTLAEFAATARDETNLDKLTERLVEVVDETMQPEGVALWIRSAVNSEITYLPAATHTGASDNASTLQG